jgi:hypothetical protein
LSPHVTEEKTIENNYMPQLVMPFELERGGHRIVIVTTSATLGSNLNMTLQELYVETAYPMEEASEETLREITS